MKVAGSLGSPTAGGTHTVCISKEYCNTDMSNDLMCDSIFQGSVEMA